MFIMPSLVIGDGRIIHHPKVGISFSKPLLSTEDNYRVYDREFYGSFAHIRKEQIDYSYHSNYKLSRQRFQDCVIWELLDANRVIAPSSSDDGITTSNANDNNKEEEQLLSCTHPSEPWCIFVAGACGTNKRKTIVSLVEKDRFPLLSFCYVDSDEIAYHMPEYQLCASEDATAAAASTAAGAPTISSRAKDLTKKEAGFMSEILLWAALEAGKNVLYSGQLKNTSWYGKLFQKIRKRFPIVRIAVLYIDAPSLETLRERVADRVSTTGLFVASDEEIITSYAQVPLSVAELAPMADYVCRLINTDSSKNGGDVEICDGRTWDSFRSNWNQTSAWRPGYSPASIMSKLDLRKSNLQQLLHVRNCPFSLDKSTEENYKNQDMRFYGLYANLRERLDYSYHSNYTRDRQFFQDTIIADLLRNIIIEDINGDTCSTPTEPFLVFTAGAFGSGKSYTINKLVAKGRFPLLAFVKVDPDEIRRLLPEFVLYASLCPEEAGQLTNKECGYISEIITLAGLESGKNVLVDGSLRDSEWYKLYFQMLRAKYTNLKIAILHIVAPREAVFQRANERGKETGRVIPLKTLEMALEQVPKSVKILAPLADYFCELNNAPYTDDIEIMTNGEDWEKFRTQWLQLCAWVPRVRGVVTGDLKRKSIKTVTVGARK